MQPANSHNSLHCMNLESVQKQNKNTHKESPECPEFILLKLLVLEITTIILITQ